jgi:hypothetical protein
MYALPLTDPGDVPEVVAFLDGAPSQTVQVRARADHIADTFVADGSDGDLLFCFYRTVAMDESVVHP